MNKPSWTWLGVVVAALVAFLIGQAIGPGAARAGIGGVVQAPPADEAKPSGGGISIDTASCAWEKAEVLNNKDTRATSGSCQKSKKFMVGFETVYKAGEKSMDEERILCCGAVAR